MEWPCPLPSEQARQCLLEVWWSGCHTDKARWLTFPFCLDFSFIALFPFFQRVARPSVLCHKAPEPFRGLTGTVCHQATELNTGKTDVKAGILQRQGGLTLHKSPCHSARTKTGLAYCTRGASWLDRESVFAHHIWPITRSFINVMNQQAHDRGGAFLPTQESLLMGNSKNQLLKDTKSAKNDSGMKWKYFDIHTWWVLWSSSDCFSRESPSLKMRGGNRDWLLASESQSVEHFPARRWESPQHLPRYFLLMYKNKFKRKIEKSLRTGPFCSLGALFRLIGSRKNWQCGSICLLLLSLKYLCHDRWGWSGVTRSPATASCTTARRTVLSKPPDFLILQDFCLLNLVHRDYSW